MFHGELILKAGRRSGKWVLVKPLVWQTEADLFVMLDGFVTDLASVPQILQWLVPVNGRHRRAAVLHDFLYATQPVSRARADRLFLDAMTATGVRFTQRWAMYLGVRVGGWVAWRRNNHELTTDPRAWLELHGIYRPELHGPPAEIDAIDV